jgi:hypothetical protein
MITRHATKFATGLGAGLWLVAATAGAAMDEGERVTTSLDRDVRVENVSSNSNEVRARIVNETGEQLENVRLLVSDTFLWNNERHPGENSPGGAHAVDVQGPIPPHGSTTVRFERPDPLPDRPDGQFVTEVVPTEVTLRPVERYDESYPSGMRVSPGRSSASTISR